MREESQLEDMRAAIRGDFERLARRRGAQELMNVREAEPGSANEPDPLTLAGGDGAVEAAAVADEPAEPEERSWLARLLGGRPPRQVE